MRCAFPPPDATNFALESLAYAGETHANSDSVRRACAFLLEKQMESGGWGETYMVRPCARAPPLRRDETDRLRPLPVPQSCVLGVYCQHSTAQVVQTAWAILCLVSARYPHKEPIERAVKLLMDRQLDVRALRLAMNAPCSPG